MMNGLKLVDIKVHVYQWGLASRQERETIRTTWALFSGFLDMLAGWDTDHEHRTLLAG